MKRQHAMRMDYEEGVAYMIGLCEEQQEKGLGPQSFSVGKLLIEYPGKKRIGDYRITRNGKVLTHAEIAHHIYKKTTSEKAPDVVYALDDLYVAGLKSTDSLFSLEFKELLFWITLQEEINYPQHESYSGRKLPFQRFYEAVLARLGHVDIEEVVRRTNNHNMIRPPLLIIERMEHPSFYR